MGGWIFSFWETLSFRSVLEDEIRPVKLFKTTEKLHVGSSFVYSRKMRSFRFGKEVRIENK